ncbi:MAG TPA: formimidoylglutamate deiminase [Pyrinomonadaceae bacterium]
MATGAKTLTAWLPELLYADGRFVRGAALVADAAGRVVAVTHAYERLGARVVPLKGRALLPGLVNAHSHSFQRVIRGRTEHRAAARDSFWTWREQMYAAAERLAPADLYDAARMAFLEMVLGGITAVGEFHYLHRAPGGDLYADPNLLAAEVVRAARDVGLRIALLRVAYARAGFDTPPDPRQARFIEPDAETFLTHTAELGRTLARADDQLISTDDQPTGADVNAAGADAHEARTDAHAAGARAPRAAWVGVAPHSVRAVPLAYLQAVAAYARQRALVLHMHIAEQPAELAACVREQGRTPVALLADEGVLDARFTAVHAVHVTPAEIDRLARAGAHVCACPTTERNLGDGVVPADKFFAAGIPVALGTDSHVQIDLLEDARALEYHLRLQRLERAVLAPAPTQTDAPPGQAAASSAQMNAPPAQLSALAARLFACATEAGARSIGAPGGELAPGRAADFFTVALDDPSIAGAAAADLLPAVVFALARTAVRDVAVGGRLVVEDGRHAAQGEIVTRFAKLQRKLWG